MPPGHPVGFDFDAVYEGWDGRRYVRPENAPVDEGPSGRHVGYMTSELQAERLPYGTFNLPSLWEYQAPPNDALSLVSGQMSPAPQASPSAPTSGPPTPAHAPVPPSPGPAGRTAVPAAASVAESPPAVARRLLSEAGEDADLSSATWGELVMYLRGRLTR